MIITAIIRKELANQPEKASRYQALLEHVRQHLKHAKQHVSGKSFAGAFT
jgi:hypothetical protein